MDSASVDEVKRAKAAVEAFEKACEGMEAAGVADLMRPHANLGLDLAVARGALMDIERRALPVALGDRVCIRSMDRETGAPTHIYAVGKSWVTTSGAHTGRWSLDTGAHERCAGMRIDAIDLARIRRDLARGVGAKKGGGS